MNNATARQVSDRGVQIATGNILLDTGDAEQLWFTWVRYVVIDGSWIKSRSRLWLRWSLMRASIPALEFQMFNCSRRSVVDIIGMRSGSEGMATVSTNIPKYGIDPVPQPPLREQKNFNLLPSTDPLQPSRFSSNQDMDR